MFWFLQICLFFKKQKKRSLFYLCEFVVVYSVVVRVKKSRNDSDVCWTDRDVDLKAAIVGWKGV